MPDFKPIQSQADINIFLIMFKKNIGLHLFKSKVI